MKAFIFSILTGVIIIFVSSFTVAWAITPLSKKAASLKMYMSREVVVKLLGPATWAIIPEDAGRELALPDQKIKLELYWKNPECTPVIVQFNKSHQVSGWDDGRGFCGRDASSFDPPQEYSCAKNDRSHLCH